MPNLNKVMLMGNLTRDPEVKYTPKGTAVVQFGMAINRVWKDANGAQQEEVTFLDVLAYGRTAEVIGEHFKKGKPIFVEGRLKLEQWDDKNSGKKMSKLRVVTETFQFIGDAGRKLDEGTAAEADAAASGPARRAPASPPRPPADPDLDVQADDVPF